ncbi:MAG: hypothetical protein ABW046_08115 [Actinoplanes sp.]
MPATVRLSDHNSALIARATSPGDVPRATGSLGLGGPRPVVSVVGGAGNMSDDVIAGLASLVAAFLPVIAENDAATVDGGTDSGVMRLLGQARESAGATFPAVGVAAIGTVTYPGHQGTNPDAAPLDHNHSHFVLVPGGEWGDEAGALAEVATLLAGGRPSVTLLINGGEITFTDARRSVERGRPVLVLQGTGRTADLIAAAATDPAADVDERAADLARSPLVHIVDATDTAAATAILRAALSPR